MQKRILAILGSPHKEGRTGKMLNYAVQIAEKQGYVIDYINLYDKEIAYCNGCRTCLKTQMCVRKDDVQEIAELLKICDMVILAAPTYWANMPAIVKNLFDRLSGASMMETKTFPKPRLAGKRYIFLTACNTPMPFARLCGQLPGIIRAVREYFKTSGIRCIGTVVCANTGARKKVAEDKFKKIDKILEKI